MLKREIMLALYYALGFPGPVGKDYIPSAVKKSVPSQYREYNTLFDAVMCPWKEFGNLIKVWPLISE